MSSRRIYLDHAATTPLRGEVRDVLLQWYENAPANASAVHASGRKARHALEDARQRIAALAGADASGVIFTSGGTEADNLAILGMGRDGLLVTGATEHEAVHEPAQQRDSVEIAPGDNGAVSAAAVATILEQESVGLVSIMAINNETGARSPLADILPACRKHGVPLHVDAVQAAAIDPLADLPADALTISGHKIGGPQGVGALVLRGGFSVASRQVGGGQERGLRSGTEPIPLIAGLALALELAQREALAASARMQSLKSRLERGLTEALGSRMRVNSPPGGAPHILNISLSGGVDGEMLILGLDLEGVEVSAGSACSSGTLKPSRVLSAMGRSAGEASAAIRFSLGRTTTSEEIDQAVEATRRVAERLVGAATHA